MEKGITREIIDEISETLKPLIRKDGKLYSIEEVDPYMTAFTWDPKLKEEIKNIKEYCKIPFFSYSYPILFWKPSIAEVFIEIKDNKELIENCSWFEVVHQGMDTKEGKGCFGLAIFYTKEVNGK